MNAPDVDGVSEKSLARAVDFSVQQRAAHGSVLRSNRIYA